MCTCYVLSIRQHSLRETVAHEAPCALRILVLISTGPMNIDKSLMHCHVHINVFHYRLSDHF